MFVASTLREDRSVDDLLNADYTFVNERLARHYGIPGVYGSRFRRVTLPNHDQRGGSARAGRAARDHVLSRPHIAGAARQMAAEQYFRLADSAASSRSGHEPRDQARRGAGCRCANGWRSTGQNPSCNSCHSVIDPLGFALENFDVIGGWRTIDEAGKPVDASGATASGAKIDGLAGLRALLLDQPINSPAPSPKS